METPTAVVIYPAVTWYAEQQRTRCYPTPPGLLEPSNWAKIVSVYGTRWAHRDGVVLTGAGTDLPAKSRERTLAVQAFLTGLEREGWQSHRIGGETGWFTCRRAKPVIASHTGTVMFGVLPWVDPARSTLFQHNDTADVIAGRLAAYEQLTGAIWRGTGGLSGSGLLRTMYDIRHQPRWRWDTAPAEVHGRSFELLGAHHNRPPAPGEGPFVHVYDTRAMYLAAASVAELAWDAPAQSGPREFDDKRPGYWRVNLADLQSAASRGPGLTSDQNAGLQRVVRTQNTGDMVWVTTPVLAYLTELLGPIEVHDSVTDVRRSRILRSWSERLRDARASAGDSVRPAVKDTYARTVGMFRRPGGRVYRPDWRDTVVDTAKVNMLRKVAKAGVSPLRYNVDAVWLPSHDPTADNVFADQGLIGGLHHIKTMTIDDYRKVYAVEAKTR